MASGTELPGYGAAALFALWFTWREIIPRFLGDRPRNGPIGAQSLDFWKMAIREAQADSIASSLAPKFDQQIAIFEEIRAHMAKTNEALAVLIVGEQKRGRR